MPAAKRCGTNGHKRGLLRVAATVAVRSAAQLLGGRSAAPMDERDDEYLLASKLIDDARGVGGDFADLGVIKLGHAPADARRIGKRCAGDDVAHDGLGVRG